METERESGRGADSDGDRARGREKGRDLWERKGET